MADPGFPHGPGRWSCHRKMLRDLERGYLVLVLGGNIVVVSYKSHQGRLHLYCQNRLAQQVLLWTQDEYLSIKAIYILGHMNVGAESLSR
ncbi:hypothetical protein H4Q32_003096 [Labeo rohita]|uniref:Uncharacterized protein n=1 Tax=Labeo rohita TaxID=84645 RepID=A0ABQ8MPN1_LABRO|nr:hypothetical protein H4Q32_003096 [Labeo rohita]